MSYSTGFDDGKLVLEEGLTFKERVFQYHEVYQELLDAYEMAEDKLESFGDDAPVGPYKEVAEEERRLTILMLPFVSGYDKAMKLKDKGYKLSDWEGNLTPKPASGDIGEDSADDIVDAIVGLFMIYLEAAIQDILDDISGAVEEMMEEDATLTDWLTLLSGAVVLQILAEKWFKEGDNNELAQFMRDPIRRPEQIIRNWRDKLLDGDSKNIFSQTIGSPIREAARVGKRAEKDIKRTGKRAEKEIRRWRKKLF